MKSELKELSIPYDVESCGDACVNRYLEMVSEGTTPKMSEMLALQQPPGVGITGKVFQQDQNRHGRSILDRMGGNQLAVERLRKQLAGRGYKLKSDDHYIPTAARFPGDPQAIVSNTNSHTDVQRHAESIAADRAKPKQKTRLNPRIVNRIAENKIKQDPSLALNRDELNQSIVEKHGGKKET